MSAARRIFANVLKIDAGAFDPVFALRSALGVTIAIVVGFYSGQPMFAVAAAMGSISTGFASLQGVYRSRAGVMIVMAFAMALSMLAGAAAARSLPLEIAALAVWGAAYGLISVLGPGSSAVGLNATIALVIFSNFPLDVRTTFEAAGFMLFGGLVQTLLLVASWPVVRYPQERAALAKAFRSLATYARSIDCANPTVPPAEPLSAVRTTLEDPRPFGRRATFAAFQTLLDEALRLRSTLGRIASTNCTGYLPFRDLTGDALDAIAGALEAGREPGDGSRFAQLETRQDDPQVAALFGQLRATWRSAAIPLGGFHFHYPSLPHFDRSDFEESLVLLRSNLNLSAPFGRHAVRVGLTLAVVGVLAHVLPIARGYWMTLTASLVLRPDFTTTYVRGVARIAGTLIGVLVATVLVSLLPDATHASLALAICFAAAGYAVFQMNYALYTVTLTAYVVFILSLLGLPEKTAALDRSVATIAGGALAMIGYAVWPTWESPQTRRRLRELLAADRAYIDAVLAGRPTVVERDAVWSARTAAEASLERMLGEPVSNDDMPRAAALGIMAASQRLGLANLALNALFAAEPAQRPRVAPFAASLDRTFDAIDASLGGRRTGIEPYALREAYARLELQGECAMVLDMVVDAVNTIAEIAASEGG